MMPPGSDITTLLGLATGGDRRAQEELFRLVEGELRKRAKAHLRHEQPSPNLQTTVLVDEAFVRLVGGRDVHWEDRTQFYCCAARVMREILVDEARRRQAERRGGGERAAALDRLAEPIARQELDPLTVLAVHEALVELAGSNPDLAQVVELHHFGGWDLKDIAADILHIPYATVKRKWRRAKALLHRAIAGGE